MCHGVMISCFVVNTQCLHYIYQFYVPYISMPGKRKLYSEGSRQCGLSAAKRVVGLHCVRTKSDIYDCLSMLCYVTSELLKAGSLFRLCWLFDASCTLLYGGEVHIRCHC